jgi:mannan endo-1,4-beta-mannosidase
MNVQPSDADYNRMVQVANGKPIALGETGAVPSPSTLQRQNRWVWFMVGLNMG